MVCVCVCFVFLLSVCWLHSLLSVPTHTADYILKFMVYAQQEICAMKMDAMEAKNAELVRLEANMRTEEQAIKYVSDTL